MFTKRDFQLRCPYWRRFTSKALQIPYSIWTFLFLSLQLVKPLPNLKSTAKSKLSQLHSPRPPSLYRKSVSPPNFCKGQRKWEVQFFFGCLILRNIYAWHNPYHLHPYDLHPTAIGIGTPLGISPWLSAGRTTPSSPPPAEVCVPPVLWRNPRSFAPTARWIWGRESLGKLWEISGWTARNWKKLLLKSLRQRWREIWV